MEIIFLTKFIKVEDITIDNKPTDEKYKLFKVDEAAIVEPFVKLEHKDYKQLIKNNIKPVTRRDGKEITINGKQTQFECKVCSHIFSNFTSKRIDVILKCPHCRHTLTKRDSLSSIISVSYLF